MSAYRASARFTTLVANDHLYPLPGPNRDAVRKPHQKATLPLTTKPIGGCEAPALHPRLVPKTSVEQVSSLHIQKQDPTTLGRFSPRLTAVQVLQHPKRADASPNIPFAALIVSIRQRCHSSLSPHMAGGLSRDSRSPKFLFQSTRPNKLS